MAWNLQLNDVWEAKFICVLGDQVSQNVLHYRITALAGTPTDVMLAAALDTNFNLLYKALMSVQAQYRGVIVQRVNPLPRTYAAFTIANAGVGALAGDPLPKQTCGVLTKRTVFAGAKFRGRLYIPFPSEGVSDAPSGRPSAGYLGSAALLGVGVQTPIPVGGGGNTCTAIPCIHHGGGATSDITTCDPRPYWATQRRRSDFGSQNISSI